MKIYKTRIITKDLESIPFDRAFRLCEDAADLAFQTHRQQADEQFEFEIRRLEQAWTASHEAPSEVSFADQVAYPRLDEKSIRRRARQKSLVEEFIPEYKLDTILQQYVMPQIIRWITRNFSQTGDVTTLTVEGQIDGRKILNKIFDFSKEWDRGLYYFLMLDSRSSYLKTQYKGEAKAYCGLVPLIPYAFKLHHSIPYSSWDRNTLHWVVNDALCSAMLCEPPEVSREELLAIRESGLLFKTGAKQGEPRNPISTYKLYGIQDSLIGDLPELAQTMLTQIWCAHPANRTKYMVLDPLNWDSIPAPLVGETLFKPEILKSEKLQVTTEDLPWMQ